MKYKYPYCGQCDGCSRDSDECGPACSECGDSDWMEMIEDDISKGEVWETGGFLWTCITRYAEYPSLSPEGNSVAKRMGLVVRVERITHSYDVAEIYYLNASEEQIKAIEEALRKEKEGVELEDLGTGCPVCGGNIEPGTGRCECKEEG